MAIIFSFKNNFTGSFTWAGSSQARGLSVAGEVGVLSSGRGLSLQRPLLLGPQAPDHLVASVSVVPGSRPQAQYLWRMVSAKLSEQD